MNLTWADVLSNVIAGIIVAVLGILAGFVSGYAFSLAEKRLSYTSQQAKGLTRFTFSLLLAIGVILSPTKLDDARGLSKMVASVPAVMTANVIVRRKAGSRDRQQDDLRKRIKIAQVPSPEDIRRATTIDPLPPTRRRFHPPKRQYRGSVTSRNSSPKISSLFQGKRDSRKLNPKQGWDWYESVLEILTAKFRGGEQNRWK